MKIKKMLFFALLLFSFHAFSQTTGKITGNVTDAETGDALPGANVTLVGTTMGAATDLSGDFFIINIPPGSYTLQVQMMGYDPQRATDIRVSVNRTTTQNFLLTQGVIEGEMVEVTASKVTVKKDQTSSVRNISSEDISVLPVENVGQVVSMQPGVVGSNFRGGRSNEVSYMVDGVATTESFNHTGQAVSVNPDVVEEIEVITGTFNAEYGNAMSGVVNIVTKEGNNNLESSGSVNLGNYVTGNSDKFIGLEKSDFSRIQDFKLRLSGPIIKDKLHFIIDGRYYNDDGYLNGIRRFNVNDFSDFGNQDSTLWYSEVNGDSSYVPMAWSENINFFSKLTFKPTTSLKLALNYITNNNQSQSYNHLYKFNPDGKSTAYDESQMVSLHMNHMISWSAFHELKLSLSDYQHGDYVYENPLDSRYIHDQYHRNSGPTFWTGGQEKGHTIRQEKKTDLKYDLTWQINKHHSIKTGINYTQIDLDNQFSNIRNSFEGKDAENQRVYDYENNKIIFPNYSAEVRPDSSIYSDIYAKSPIQFAAYMQDKMEFKSMVVNFGLRYDYFDPQTVYPTNWRNPANQDYFQDKNFMSQYPKVKPQHQISPRLGLSYQLGESALLRFSYGHFFQVPPLNFYYQNSTFRITELNIVGNPLLKAQKTVQYEVGLWQQLAENMDIEVTVFYRDIYELLSSRLVYTYSQIRFGLYDNKDYGNVRGMELKYHYRLGQIDINTNYTLQYTRGVADNPLSSFSRAGSDMDPVNKLIPLAWDQRHTLNASVGYNTKKVGATFVMYYNSGQPYTWHPINESPLALINLLPNNQYRPSKFSTDLNAYYNIATFGKTKLTLTLLVYNLFDALNENGVNPNTGRAYTSIIRPTTEASYRSNFSTVYDVAKNPNMFAAPRTVKVGLGFRF